MVCWCGREHNPLSAIGMAHAHREHSGMFRRYPHRPACSCGWRPAVFYRDAYHALGHWLEHAESALTEGESAEDLQRRGTPCPTVDKGMTRGGQTPSPSVSALGAPAAPRQKHTNRVSSCPAEDPQGNGRRVSLPRSTLAAGAPSA